MCFVLNKDIDFMLLLSFLIVLVESVINYGALLFVEYMKDIAELVSVVKLSDFVLMFWVVIWG